MIRLPGHRARAMTGFLPPLSPLSLRGAVAFRQAGNSLPPGGSGKRPSSRTGWIELFAKPILGFAAVRGRDGYRFAPPILRQPPAQCRLCKRPEICAYRPSHRKNLGPGYGPMKGSGGIPKMCVEEHMTTKHRLQTGAAIIALVLAVGAAPTGVWAQQAAPAVNIGATDIGGVVRGPNGPEAGVWVIAETTDLPTRMSKTVVTDDQGRYVIPDLPKANYIVWARGYGLVDSAKTTSASPARSSTSPPSRRRTRPPRRNTIRRSTGIPCCEIPGKNMFPGTGTGANGNGIADRHEDPGAVAGPDQDQRLLHLPSARQQGDAHDFAGARHLQELGRSVGAAHPVRPGDGADGRRHRPPGHGDRSPTWPSGPTGSRPANCRSPSRSGRKASSATS